MDSGYTQRVLDALRMTLVPEQASVDEGTRLLKEVLYKEGPFPAVLLTLAVSKEVNSQKNAVNSVDSSPSKKICNRDA
jgi:hypothetical protein